MKKSPPFPCPGADKSRIAQDAKIIRDPILSGDQDDAELDADGKHTIVKPSQKPVNNCLIIGGAVEIIEPQSLHWSVQDLQSRESKAIIALID
jgi:hypothetical protein